MRRLDRAGRHRVQFVLNGEPMEGYAEPRILLCDYLRHELGATGTHVGCEHGVCGACTVRIDGHAVRSCLVFAVQAEGCEVRTIEGLADDDGSFSALQKAFHENFALQCGFCTPGILMSLSQYLERNPDPSKAEIRRALSGNICRCTGYHEIVTAALEAAQAMRNTPGDEQAGN